ncbi:MAG TPA: hypothetical protein VMY36_04290 [Patescibacteria group bacterium]|nr:hypothetical protein [Patescibacteria group bacterium]
MRDIDFGPQEIPNQNNQGETQPSRDVDKRLLVSSYEIFKKFKELPHRFAWPRSLERGLKGEVYEYLQDFCDVMNLASESDLGAFPRFHQERVQFLNKLADHIKRRRRYRLLNDFTERVSVLSDLYPEIASIVTMGNFDLYLLLCDEDQILAGSKNGLWYKEINLENHSPEEKESTWESIVLQMSAFFRGLGRSAIELVPDHFITREDLKELNLPQPAKSIEELLEEAYYRQRYTVSPEGAEVRLQNAGDLKTIVVKQIGNMIMAKAVTTLGEALVIVDLDRATAISPEIIVKKEPVLANILAEVYRDLVVAVEIPSSGKKRKRASVGIPTEERTPREPTYIYIPRKRWVRGEETEMPIRTPYEGPRRPRQFHEVTGHKRHVNMTEAHRLALIEYEEETGLRILDFLPEGCTFVRRHFRGGTEADIKNLPTFIKIKIQTKLEESLNLPDLQ